MEDPLKINITWKDRHLLQGRFHAMASPCEVLLDTSLLDSGQRVIQAVVEEVKRIERKFSRYRSDSCISNIVQHAGQPTPIDAETHRLLDFAGKLFELSDGLFDVSSGVLRQAWRFDGKSHIPTQAMIDACLPRIGWHHVKLSESEIEIPPLMELDLGGIGKEYAVDKAFLLAESLCDCAMLINLGGDLRVRGPRHDGLPWWIGIEQPDHPEQAHQTIKVNTGAIATSGNSRRFIEANGVRYGHLINPKTGWPVVSDVRSVTVVADTCTTAGMLTSLSLLSPDGAKAFLQAQEGIQFWTC
jgi:thiamine biosynthesis lipoprotein